MSQVGHHAFLVTYEAYWDAGRRELAPAGEQRCTCGDNAFHADQSHAVYAQHTAGDAHRWRVTAGAPSPQTAHQIARAAANALAHLHHPLFAEEEAPPPPKKRPPAAPRRRT